jgi:hypothetical protein
VFWPIGTGDSTTIVVDDEIVMQVDLHDMDKADDDANPEVPSSTASWRRCRPGRMVARTWQCSR